MALTIRIRTNGNYKDYPTTWKNLALTARHIGDIYNLDTVDVWNGNEWFMSKMTNRSLSFRQIAR